MAMKYFLFIFLLFPLLAFAHTSDERYTDGYIVDLSTAPVAPWVGEKTGMVFVFRDPVNGLATTTVKSASFTIDVLMRKSLKPPETIFHSQKFNVKNSEFTTDHIFTEVGTYDLHLYFVDEKGVTHQVGYRKQIRDGGSGNNTLIGPKVFFITLFVIGVLGFFAGRLSYKQ